MLKFNSLVLIPSDHCNIKCAHCAPECGPTIKKGWDPEIFKKCIGDAKNIPNLTKSIHFAGGEPFLYFNNILDTAKYAYKKGFNLSVVTNGFWAYSEEKARNQIRKLASLGLNRAELSFDSFHREFVPTYVIKNAIKILKENNIMICLRVVTTRRHQIDETLRELNSEDLDGIEVAGSPMVPSGRAITSVSEEDYYLSERGSIGNCADVLNLTVRADGHVAVCCAGSDMTPSLWIGNILKTSLDQIAKQVEWNMLIKKLVHQGPSSFFEILKNEGLEHKIKPSYTNICHACYDLFNDTQVVSAVKKWIFTTQQKNLASKLEQIPDINWDELSVPKFAEKCDDDLIQIKSLY